MKRVNKIGLWFSTLLVATSCVILMAGQCGAGSQKIVRPPKVSACVEYKKKDECKLGETTANKDCRWNAAANNNAGACEEAPIVPALMGECKDQDKTQCGKRIDCKFNATAAQCEKAATEECGNVTDKDYCDTLFGAKSKYNCEWDPTAASPLCKEANRGPTSKYYSYEFGTLPDYFPVKVMGVASSKDQSHWYIMLGEDIRVSDDDAATWSSVKPLKAEKPTGGDKLAITGHVIDLYEPLNDGLMVQTAEGYGIISKKSFATAWKLNVGNLGGKNKPAVAFKEIKKTDNTLWIYAAADGGTVAEGVAFQQKAALTDLWNKTIKDSGNIPLTSFYTALGEGRGGAMYLGNANGIHLLPEAQIGIDGGKLDTVNNKPTYTAAELPLADGSPNDAKITAMTLVDDTYLLIGFAIATKGGGVGVMNIDTDAWTYLKLSNNPPTVSKIIASADKREAMIQSEIGLVIFKDGAFVEVVPGQPLITQALANDPNNASSFDKTAPKTGFKGGLAGLPDRGAMKVGGKWLFGTSAGVVTLEIKEKDL